LSIAVDYCGAFFYFSLLFLFFRGFPLFFCEQFSSIKRKVKIWLEVEGGGGRGRGEGMVFAGLRRGIRTPAKQPDI
jgi:hypothetical protein